MSVISDPIAQLRRAGEKLSPAVRRAVVELGERAVPALIACLADEDWPSIHAVDVLVDLKATAAIVPLLRKLAETEVDDIIHSRIAVRLPELGAAVLEPALAAFSEHEEHPDTRIALCEIMAKLGVRDDRAFDALVAVFNEDYKLGAGRFAEYGDPKALPLLHDEIKHYEPDFTEPWTWSQLTGLVHTYVELGGTLTPEVRQRVEAWDATFERLHLERKLAEARHVGRNDPCPCGSGKKYKKCCLAAVEEAARSAGTRGSEPR